MKKIYTFLLFCIFSYTVNAQFIMTFKIDNTYGHDITVPVSGGSFTIDFGDGTVLSNQDKHTYKDTDTYTVTVTGSFDRINFNTPGLNLNNNNKLKTIEQWGNTKWSTMESAFYDCVNLIINATDVPDLSKVTNMNYMFSGASSFNQPIQNWDVSNVTDMKGLFLGAASFNQPINNWDVSKVTNMLQMFDAATSFNQPLNNWNVSNVSEMTAMFHGASSFNQPIDKWDVSSVTNMYFMFSCANSFNQPIDSWDVSSVIDMTGMFSSSICFKSSFNQPLNNWDVSNVIYMGDMFYHAFSFNQPLNNWNVSKVLDMQGMFDFDTSFNQDISNWNFNSDVKLESFVRNSDLDVNYYDALLGRFAQLGLRNKNLRSSGLAYCNIGVHDYLINTLNWKITRDSLSNNCGDNIITGHILYDENSNGCDKSDLPVSNLLLKTYNLKNTSSTISNNSGEYELYVYAGKYYVKPINLPSYITCIPDSFEVTFTGSGKNQKVDFCIKANQTIEDLKITILPINQARPGFEANYQLIIENKGTKTTNASISLTFDNSKQSFVSAQPNPNNTTANELKFDIVNFKPFQNMVINFTMKTFTPPTVNGGDKLNFIAKITPVSNDYTPKDNEFILNEEVVNAYDPNDKQVLQGDKILIDQVDEYLHYLIRFQNTGTASAINVRLEDVLDSTVDWNTIQMINASHDYSTKITNGNQLEFLFENIKLPYEVQDAVGSHGFIAYKIKPKTNTKLGDIIIRNEVKIYFDYNLPIITNAVSTEVVKEILGGVFPLDFNNSISVYPNPADDFISISSDKNAQLKSAKIYSMDGQELFYQVDNLNAIDIKNLNSGIYILQVETNMGIINKKLLKAK